MPVSDVHARVTASAKDLKVGRREQEVRSLTASRFVVKHEVVGRSTHRALGIPGNLGASESLIALTAVAL